MDKLLWQKVREDERVQRAEQDVRDECECHLGNETLDCLFTQGGQLAYAKLVTMRLRVTLEIQRAARLETERLLREYPTGTWAGD